MAKGNLPGDTGGKKFAGAQVNDGGTNKLVATRGVNFQTINGEEVVDLPVFITGIGSATLTLGIKAASGSFPVTLASDEAMVGVEDAAYANASKGVRVLGVRKDAATNLVSTNGDLALLEVDANGCLWVHDNTLLAEDAPYTNAVHGRPMLAVRTDTPASRVSANGDYTIPQTDALGNLWVNLHNSRAQVILTPGAPTPAGSDITQADGSPIDATDLTIRDTNEHVFLIPMGSAGYRSIVIGMENKSGTAWDQVPNIKVYGWMANTATYKAAKLLDFDSVVNQSIALSIGAGDVGVGGISGTDPAVAASNYPFYNVPSLLAGWPYIALSVKFAVSPSQGEFAWIATNRMKF